MDEHRSQAETQLWDEAPGDDKGGSSEAPVVVGRYRLIRQLGQGGFGRVFLAHDQELDRQVAVKVPNRERVASAEGIEGYLAEARVVAGLDHPHIVPVYDVGRTPDGICFVVSKYIEGSDLAAGMGDARPSLRGAVEIVAIVAEALHYAHTRGLVHRDIKPANILIDASGQPWVADFGLALKDEDFGRGARIAGTPSYMSPEQARGEGHRVDGRSDIFSLGIVLYELMTGRRPFRGKTAVEIRELIALAEPRPPRQIDDTIPRELERICLKALSKRAAERFSTARDMAEDLRLFLQAGTAAESVSAAPAGTTSPPGGSWDASQSPMGRSGSETRLEIIPKGLRSFDQHDADFFLELLPGPRDRTGLPDSLRFWKSRIETRDPDQTFRVGLIYGPSGCGKSSLVKAGLLPRLARDVLPVYVEATPRETEARLLKGLRKECPDLPGGFDLVAVLSLLRRGRVLRSGQKVLLVLDQFEQWLTTARGDGNPELVAALRHCDGEHVQAVVMVRDDFWMAATRFMRNLEIRLVEGENSAAVDLFDPQHARKILKAFGRAFGRLSARDSELTREQLAFLEQSVAGLAQDGKVISVRLALFAEMVKGKPWTPGTLREVGGTEGVGLAFLEETFGGSSAPPEYRLHQAAAQAVLGALLPQSGGDIKGRMRSEAELRALSGYAGQPAEFDDLLRILDSELRLITPTDDESVTDGSDTPGSEAQRHYQLTHDYLVQSLRDWLTRKQRETRRGRTELLLEDRAALWGARPENRLLPTFLEWASIRLLTRPEEWSDPERRMMSRAGGAVGLKALGVAAILCALTLLGLGVSRQIVESNRKLQASGLVEQLRSANIARVPEIVRALEGYRRFADGELRRLLSSAPEESAQKLHASLALLPIDASQAEYLSDRLLSASPPELKVIGDALNGSPRGDPGRFRAVLEGERADQGRRLRAACALVRLAPDDPALEQNQPVIVSALLARENRYLLGDWADLLRPIKGELIEPLSKAFQQADSPEKSEAAAFVLAAYLDEMPRLVELFATGEAAQNAVLVSSLSAVRNPLAGTLESAVADALDAIPAATTPERAKRQANLALVLLALGRGDRAWSLFRHGQNDGVRTDLIHRAASAGVAASTLDDRLGIEPDSMVRQALWLALGEYPLAKLSESDRERLKPRLMEMYRDDPSSAVHSAADWLLRRWWPSEPLTHVDEALALGPREGREWYVDRGLHTMVVVPGPVEFAMGSPPGEIRPNHPGDQHRVRIDRSYAIASKETTYAQLARLELESLFPIEKTPAADTPVMNVTTLAAAMYCRRLSELEKLEMCYPPEEEFRKNGYQPYDDYLSRTGYRLPTEAEWEFACRAGTTTSRPFGDTATYLPQYAWHLQNSPSYRPHSVGLLKPNPIGLFDILGNMQEWCSDTHRDFNPLDRARLTEDRGLVAGNGQGRVLRGLSFRIPFESIRAADRLFSNTPANPLPYVGFRVARTLKRGPGDTRSTGR